MTFDLKRALRKKAKRDAELEKIRRELLVRMEGKLFISNKGLDDMGEEAKNSIADDAISRISDFSHMMNCKPSQVDMSFDPWPKIVGDDYDLKLRLYRNTIDRVFRYDKYGHLVYLA